MKIPIVNPLIVFVVSIAYLFVVTVPANASPVLSKPGLKKEEILNSIENDLLKAGFSRSEIKEKFQYLTNKDLIVLFNQVKAVNVAGAEDNSSMQILQGIFIVCLIILLVGVSANMNDDDEDFEKALDKYRVQ
ncbi:MAG: hypothetical protein KAI43_10385 [Candidatus Aureabacteria bacterium]|nr:hypothetical protein [Candidatus Auribacterota bacterium]